jgi:hypothetical protein
LQGLSDQAEGKGVDNATGAVVVYLSFAQWVGVVISAVVCFAVVFMSVAEVPVTIAQDILVASNASIWMHDQYASAALVVSTTLPF